MLFPMAELLPIDGYLFSEGVRDDPRPHRPTEESAFVFLDRVRQPAFERQREWWEGAYGRYPVGLDRVDVARRFQSSDEAQHFGAAWELAQHELWWRLGWTLKPHPTTSDGRHRDFLVEHPERDAFYLECAVDLTSSSERSANRRWSVVEKALAEVRSPDHQLLIDLQAIGDGPLATGSLRQRAQRALDAVPAGRRAVVLAVDQAGWQFTVQTTGHGFAGSPAVMRGGVRSLEERLYNPIRTRIIDKAQKSGMLDKPFVVALLIMYTLPIVSGRGVVEEALFGSTTTHLGPNLRPSATSNRGDGVWFDGVGARRTGVSGVLLQQDLWPGQQAPTLHLHPFAAREFTAPVSIDVCRYQSDGASFSARLEPASIAPHNLFGLPEHWPGPENWFEGINNDNPLPAPAHWDPRSVPS